MSTLRRTWLAVMGAILLITLSVSAAFGAKPADTDSPRGQSIAGFVHELVFGSEADEDEESEDADETDEDSEDEDQESEDEDSVAADEDPERQVPEEFANHGECVADTARNTDGFDESDAENFGAWVSMHARYVCWGLEPPTDETDEDVAEDDEEGDSDSEDAMTKAERKAAREAARDERKAAREVAKADRMAAHAAAKADRFAAKAAAKAARGH